MGFPFLQTNQDQAKVQSKLKIMWYLAFMNGIFKRIMIIIIKKSNNNNNDDDDDNNNNNNSNIIQ